MLGNTLAKPTAHLSAVCCLVEGGIVVAWLSSWARGRPRPRPKDTWEVRWVYEIVYGISPKNDLETQKAKVLKHNQKTAKILHKSRARC